MSTTTISYKQLNLEEAILLLSECKCFQLKDKHFGDSEYTWIHNGDIVAHGYQNKQLNTTVVVRQTTFTSFEARELLKQHDSIAIELN